MRRGMEGMKVMAKRWRAFHEARAGRCREESGREERCGGRGRVRWWMCVALKFLVVGERKW